MTRKFGSTHSLKTNACAKYENICLAWSRLQITANNVCGQPNIPCFRKTSTTICDDCWKYRSRMFSVLRIVGGLALHLSPHSSVTGLEGTRSFICSLEVLRLLVCTQWKGVWGYVRFCGCKLKVRRFDSLTLRQHKKMVDSWQMRSYRLSFMALCFGDSSS